MRRDLWLKTVFLIAIIFFIMFMIIAVPVFHGDPVKPATVFPVIGTSDDLAVVLSPDNRQKFNAASKSIQNHIDRLHSRQLAVVKPWILGSRFSPGCPFTNLTLILFSIFYRISRTSRENASHRLTLSTYLGF